MTDLSAPRVSHHDRILTAFRDKITSGEWPPGFQLPFETRLAQDHGVSRMTMNKVLGQLTREGFLIRRKKRGTCVAEPMAQAAVMAIGDIGAEIAALGHEWRYALQERALRLALPEEARALKVVADDMPVLALVGVHYASDAAFCHEARIINLGPAPAAAEVDFTVIAPGPWLMREIPWTSAQHRIRAVGASAPMARALDVPVGTPCLEVTRRTEISGQWVTLVTQTYPGDRHELVADFAPNIEG